MSVLLFTIALNGYGAVYARCLRSQKAYATRYGYDYEAICRPRGLISPDVSSWVKIPLMREALHAGYNWVFFIDADCEIRSDAPPIESIERPGKTLYMATGYSGRVNAGVIIARRSPQTMAFLTTVLENASKPVPDEDQALYENGHVIHYAKGLPCLQVLDARWNNNRDPGLHDYVRHYSAGGPMRKLYRKSALGLAVHVANRVQTKIWRKLNPQGTPAGKLRGRLDQLTRECLSHMTASMMQTNESPQPVPPEEMVVHE